MLALVADLAIKAVILNPHLGKDAAKKSPGVVLIEELDMCLHPTWQQHVLEDLRAASPNVQFIASTRIRHPTAFVFVTVTGFPDTHSASAASRSSTFGSGRFFPSCV